MRPVTLHFRGGEQIMVYTIVRGGIIQHISHCMMMDGIGTVVGYGFLRLKNEFFDLQSPTVVPGTYDDVLSACPWLQAGSGHVYHRNIGFRIDDRQKLYVMYDNCGGSPANIEQVITLWIEEFPREEPPEEDLPQPRRLARDRGRSFNLEQLRVLLNPNPTVSEPHRRKKPAH